MYTHIHALLHTPFTEESPLNCSLLSQSASWQRASATSLGGKEGREDAHGLGPCLDFFPALRQLHGTIITPASAAAGLGQHTQQVLEASLKLILAHVHN